ncbi:hypothetical protein [Paenibacillus amylolyticus]|uniref:hypothetical protein n=1 Tax=Paenibacillus amylolyticus TaxID=1451 RepID=UPI00249ABF26|nr:hypothetical protein [Paenibacillus amylolyticus]WFA86486.1 hypothetical protein OGI70_06040 [Paenibacillus amylolyticus]
MNKAPEKVKLSQLSADTLLSYEDAREAITVSELIDRFDRWKGIDFTWHVVTEMRWQPSAARMIERYIESEYDDMYEDWDDRANDCLKQEYIDRIQTVLDEAFKGEYATKYWVLDGPEVVIDGLPGYTSTSLAEGDQSTE